MGMSIPPPPEETVAKALSLRDTRAPEHEGQRTSLVDTPAELPLTRVSKSRWHSWQEYS